MRVLNRLIPAVLLLCSLLLLSACDSAEERAEKHFQNAIALLAEGDIDRAVVELRNAYNLDTRHVGARLQMAEIQLERGNKQGAYNQYLLLAESYPDDVDSRIMLSELAFPAGNWEEFERHGARLEELAPDNPRVKVITLVRAYRAAIDDDDDSTRRELGRQAEQTLTDLPENLLLRATLIDHALRDQQFTQALTQIDWMIEFDPKNSSYHQERLRVLATLGDMEAVEAQLQRMMELFPDDPAHKETLIRFYVSRENLDGAEAVLRDLAAASPPDDPGPTVDLIRFLAAFRTPEDVRVAFDKAMAERSDPVPFQVMQASFEFSLGNRDEGIATLRDLLENAEPSSEILVAKVTLARMLLATGNEVGARALVEEILAENATHPEALKMQAAWQIEADDTDAAIGGLRQALDQNPRDAEVMTLMARAYTRAGQPELAKDFLAQAVEASGNAPAETLRYSLLLLAQESYLPAEDILLTALRLEPSNTDLLTALGQLYLRMEDYGRVTSVIGALRRYGGDAALEAANGLEAERLSRQEGMDSAISYLENLANEADATLGLKITLVRTKLGIGDEIGALELVRELKEENPDSEALDVVMAVVQIANGNLDDAATIYRQLLSKDPVRPRIWLDLARLQARQGDREGFEASFQEGLKHSPEDPNLLWAKASFEEREGNIDEAIEIYETLYAQDSNRIIVANNLASLLATHRDDAESLDRAWQVARRLREAVAPAMMDTYGWILHRREKSEEALPYLEGAAKGLPSDPIVQYHLGQAYVAVNRPQDAIEQFRRAVAIAGPVDVRPQIEDARRLMQSLQDAGTAEN